MSSDFLLFSSSSAIVTEEDPRGEHERNFTQLYRAMLYQLGEIHREYQHKLVDFKQMLTVLSSSASASTSASNSGKFLPSFHFNFLAPY
jgi:hypothetical protein